MNGLTKAALAVGTAAAVGSAGYYFWPQDGPDNLVEQPQIEVSQPTTQVLEEPETEATIDHCPKAKDRIVVKEVPKVVYQDRVRIVEKIVPKIVYKEAPTKVIEREVIPDKHGCFVDWENKRVVVISNDTTSVRCLVDWAGKKVHARRRQAEAKGKRLY